MSKRNKFYKVECQWKNLHWHTLKFFRKEPDAKEWASKYESDVPFYPVRVEELEFGSVDDETSSS